MIKGKIVEKYYDPRSACQVLGVLMIDPQLLKSRKYNLEQSDFVGGMHQTIFTCIYNLANQGVKQIGIGEIETYLANTSPIDHTKVFERNNGEEWISKTVEDANSLNFDYHYQTVKKMALMRSYLSQGITIKDILDLEEIEPNTAKKQRDVFDNMSIEEIVREVDKRNLVAKKHFLINGTTKTKKAGDGAKELYEKTKQSPSYGLAFESKYLNTVLRGAGKKKVLLETRDTGCGKSRVAIKRLLGFTAPYLWDYEKETFVENPNGVDNGALYIGTEMEQDEEIEPMMWAFLSGIDEERIRDNNLTADEEERVQKAIQILENTKLFLVDEEDISVTFLWNIIEEYKLKYNIYAVAVDYIEITSGMIGEFVQDTKGMTAREDMVLLNLSKNLKNMARKLDVFINAFTQTTDEARRDEIRDQRAVKGARSLPNKVDAGIVTFEPTNKELEKLEPIMEKITGLVKSKTPNICYSFYKNRGGSIKNIKIWGYQNLGNMEYYDLFCTDNNYKLLNINPTKIKVVGNQITTL